MKIPKQCKLGKLLPRRMGRIMAISHVHLDTNAMRVIATNGKAMAIIPTDVFGSDTSGPITDDALKAAKGADIMANGSLKVAHGAEYPRPNDLGSFPDYRAVLPTGDPQAVESICLDVRLLWDLVQAMGCQSVSLEFHGKASGISVRPIKDAAAPDAVGVLMPISN